jgi:hypothetical protein
MAGLVVPAIHVLLALREKKKDVDAKLKAEHDDPARLRPRPAGG